MQRTTPMLARSSWSRRTRCPRRGIALLASASKSSAARYPSSRSCSKNPSGPFFTSAHSATQEHPLRTSSFPWPLPLPWPLPCPTRCRAATCDESSDVSTAPRPADGLVRSRPKYADLLPFHVRRARLRSADEFGYGCASEQEPFVGAGAPEGKEPSERELGQAARLRQRFLDYILGCKIAKV